MCKAKGAYPAKNWPPMHLSKGNPMLTAIKPRQEYAITVACGESAPTTWDVLCDPGVDFDPQEWLETINRHWEGGNYRILQIEDLTPSERYLTTFWFGHLYDTDSDGEPLTTTYTVRSVEPLTQAQISAIKAMFTGWKAYDICTVDHLAPTEF